MKTLFISQDLCEFVKKSHDESAVAPENHKRDAKALFFIQQAIDEMIFPCIEVATKAKEAWDVLQKSYQGNSKVLIVKLQTLRRNFEGAFMKENESLEAYSIKLSKIVNQMRKFRDDMTEQKVVEKILRSLPRKYEQIVAAIEEANDLSDFTVDELLGSLYCHEDRLKL